MWWKAIIGAAIVLVTVQQMFRDLFHPTQSGALSDWIGDKLFRLFRRSESLLPTAGPLTVVVVIFLWALLLATGFAFVYWTAFPGSFVLRTPNHPTSTDSFWWCFYYSLQMLTTLGLGDIQPVPTWLRLLSVFHTLVGFSLVTASLTWIIVLYPALSRTRTLARHVATLTEAESETGISIAGSGMHGTFLNLAESVQRARVDLVHFPILFFFYASDPRSSLPLSLLKLKRMAERAAGAHREDRVRFSAEALARALEQTAETIAPKVDSDDCSANAVFPALVRLHSPKGIRREEI